MKALCILLALLVLPSMAEAKVKAQVPLLDEIVKTLPKDLLYDGKPLDPGCVEATNPPDGPVAEQNLKTCAASADRTTNGIEVGTGGMLGLTYKCNGEFCGYAGYLYLGQMGDGFVILTHANSAGSAQYSSIRLLKRKGDVISSEFLQPTGDRCIGGIVDAELKDGMLQYSYNATLADLAETYAENENIPTVAGSASDCAAVIRKVGGVISTIDFKRTDEQLADDPACFADAYREAAKKGTSFDVERMKDLFTQAGNACEQDKAD